MSSSAIAPRPNQACTSPACIKNGTRVPEAAMPRPTPVKIAPLASPRRDGATCGSTTGAASAIKAPPEIPDAKRQTKNQPKESGKAQAKNAALATAIIPRSVAAAPARSAIGRASKAPPR